MSVKGVKGGGRSTGPGRASGPAKSSGAGFNAKVDGAQRAVGPAGASGASGVAQTGAAGPVDAVTVQVLDIARQLKAGQIKSREEATKRLVSDIIREKVHTRSKKLTAQVYDSLSDDPRLQQTLERMWTSAEAEQE